MKDCVFCKIIKGELPAKKEYEDEQLIVFHDINPKAPLHLLVIPKKHISRLAEATSADILLLGHCQWIAAQIAKKLGIGEAFQVSVANGKIAGQSIFHLHYHLRGGWGEQDKPEW